MSDEPRQPVKTGVARWLLVASGLLLTTLATVGAFLPVLPTTPFLLVAAACFVRSSPSLHRRLTSNRVFGPYLRQWEHDHTIPREAKRKAYGLVVITFAVSIYLLEPFWPRAALGAVGISLLGFLAWLPTTTQLDVPPSRCEGHGSDTAPDRSGGDKPRPYDETTTGE